MVVGQIEASPKLRWIDWPSLKSTGSTRVGWPKGSPIGHRDVLLPAMLLSRGSPTSAQKADVDDNGPRRPRRFFCHPKDPWSWWFGGSFLVLFWFSLDMVIDGHQAHTKSIKIIQKLQGLSCMLVTQYLAWMRKDCKALWRNDLQKLWSHSLLQLE